MINPYDDMIYLPRHTSTSRSRMSAHDRAAQFSPFAALTGYDSAITETARLTDIRIDLDESCKVDLNKRLSIIQEHLDELVEVSITYFRSDEKKSGGSYVTASGCVKKIDEYEHVVVMQDDTKILIDDIIDIDGGILYPLIFDEFR